MKKDSAESPDKLGGELGVVLPPGVRIAGVHREAGIDALVAVKIELGADEARAFLEASPVKAEAMRPGTRGFLGPNHDWWDPSQAPGLRTGQAQLAAGRVLNIGVSERGATTVLYLVAHGT
jgi:hypothetical protein